MAQLQSRSLIAREKVIRATIRLLADGGHENCTLERVAAESKVAKGSVQHHFKSQDGLLLETYRTLMNRAVGSWSDLTKHEAGPRLHKQLSDFIDFVIDRAGSEEHRATIRILIVTTGKTRLSKKLRAAQQRALQDAFEAISIGLRRAPDYSPAGEKAALAIAQNAIVAANCLAFASLAHVENRHLGAQAGAYVATLKKVLRRELKTELAALSSKTSIDKLVHMN